ncbi:MAG: D-lysine 5,6-aminomutase subunit alpha [Candidatus Wallbacteria bacterium HGW-Wallbacteria-1]|uniref:D-lysine 5,6-aminomutase subunit alpha n=1 Tax=Candidatus Wallbacteria bacterium HGW-Wallbacteria-1 TaxID=2013854 RepID=A0A2N1PL23_9BACT|nr:MAG: D-lysine 5,6-aminomutase subunit alpha [Candidatus Wallbacteria bacterium HGW-Wallbacteria-1]
MSSKEKITNGKLNLSEDKIAEARKLAAEIVAPVQSFISAHTTTAVERTTLRLMGADGINSSEVPVPNIVVDSLADKLGHGAARYFVNALLKTGSTVEELNRKIQEGLDITALDLVDFCHIETRGKELVDTFDRRVSGNVAFRNEKLEKHAENIGSPLLYVIVATGNIHEDTKQAQAAARQGADVIAVIRTTAQSLLDYVPYGATTEGFGGTYATQENFRIMRRALDEVGEEVSRYIRLVNYCSGLAMPEIAAMGALERLDMMLNDSMYGILFRDINMYRTFVDQNFSRMINSFADIIINTGEDNYLTTSDAFEKAYTVLASQFLNEKFASNSGLPARLMGLGHAFEMNPKIRNGFLYELSQAQMAREIFPEAPLKYMPPTKYMTGDIFMGLAMNTLFNFIAKGTNQGILLLGMLTEAIHTPFMQDRFLAIQNARYVSNNMCDFMSDIEFKTDGIMQGRARDVLDSTIRFLTEVRDMGLFDSIEKGMFAEVKRPKNGGKGFDGVTEKASDYWNPFETFLNDRLNLTSGRQS